MNVLERSEVTAGAPPLITPIDVSDSDLEELRRTIVAAKYAAWSEQGPSGTHARVFADFDLPEVETVLRRAARNSRGNVVVRSPPGVRPYIVSCKGVTTGQDGKPAFGLYVLTVLVPRVDLLAAAVRCEHHGASARDLGTKDSLANVAETMSAYAVCEGCCAGLSPQRALRVMFCFDNRLADPRRLPSGELLYGYKAVVVFGYGDPYHQRVALWDTPPEPGAGAEVH